jgi:transposase-like protein
MIRMSKSGPKIITLDIETAPIESYHWGLFDQNIGLDQIKVDWSIMAFCVKPLGDDNIVYADTSGRGKRRVRDDSGLLRQLWQILDDADIVVAQNGARFDVPKINARLISSGYGPYSPIRVIDTLAVSRKYFKFTSNKLAWTSKLTDQPKDEHRQFPGFELWKECLKDNPEAWAEMKKYNIADVVATEALYLKQRPWIKGHPDIGAYAIETDQLDIQQGESCPKCGSTNTFRNGSRRSKCKACLSSFYSRLKRPPAKVTRCPACGGKCKKSGFSMTTAGKYQQYQCKQCGKYSRGKENLIPLATRKQVLV